MRPSIPTPTRSHTPTPPPRWWDPLAAILLLAAISTAVTRLTITQWTDHLNLVPVLASLGVVAGLALGQSIFSPRRVAAFALAYGLFAVTWQLGLTLGHGILWTERLVSMAGRLIVALGQLARQEAVEDPFLFLSLMTSLFWTLGVYAGYNLTRHARPWRAILPAGLTLLIIQIYDPFVTSRIWLLGGYLFFSISLLARLTYLHHHARWEQKRVRLPLYIGFDLTRTTLLLAALLVVVAWNIPVLADVSPFAEEAWQSAAQPWITVRDHLSKAFAPLQRTTSLIRYYEYYGEHLSLGSGNELSDTLIMTVEAQPHPDGSIRYYWRARVYDRYANAQWASTLSTTQPVTPTNFGLTLPEAEERKTAIFAFNLAIPIATLYTAPRPLWVSRPAQANLAYNPDGTADLAALHAAEPLRAGETYQAESSLSTATIAQLRTAGTDYPSWVTDRYLQVPSTVTTRTLQLAQQIASDIDNPYDIAAAVTAYLRTRIQYSETIPPSPPDQEPLDWFLFDLRQGFCSYYASTEVILLRSLGIPARLAVGFAQGERQDDEGEGDIYLVRQRDAHAWPEVYFPGLGWVEFEPTASQLPIHRRLGESQSATAPGSAILPGGLAGSRLDDRLERIEDAELDLARAESPDDASDLRTTVVIWAAILALILAPFIWRRSRQRGLPPLPVLLEGGLHRLGLQPPSALRRWASRVTLAPLERAYLELDHALTRLNAPSDPADTPAERAIALARLLPTAAEPAQRLLAEYHAMTYSPHTGDLHIAQQAARAIRNLSWQARISRLAAHW
ncbi:MAG: transglutaminase domain-containing protein [Chloroflexota bacterium]|nr:transglutaminase domain-containing protein [Chloroflexota bacterium]